MKIFRTLWILGLTFLAGGAAFGQTITSTYDEDYGLARLMTYGFKTQERVGSDPLATDTVMAGKVREALDDALQSKGYNPPGDGVRPTFFVAFHAAVRDTADERGPGPNYIRGTLIVDFHDAETGKLVWRGIATGAVGAEAVDLKLAEEKIKRAAELLLEQFGRDLLGF
jgi:hypothetical protein